MTEKSIKDALDILGTDRTCLIIAHRLGTIRDADNIIVLNDGVVIEEVSQYSLVCWFLEYFTNEYFIV